MKKIKLLNIAIISFALSGCETMELAPKMADVSTSTFTSPDFRPGGLIALIPADIRKNESLEFNHFKMLVAQKLSRAGYSVTDDLTKAQFFAMISYGIDSGRSELVSTPMFGQISGGNTSTSGSVYSSGGVASYNSSTYSMPQFGVVGSRSDSVTVYNRALAVDIIDGDSYRSNSPKKLMELRIKSAGSCGIVAGILPFMIDGAFSRFPDPSGTTRKVSVALPPGFDC